MANVVDLIKADHRKVEELFAKFESAEDTSRELVDEILNELKKHAAAEEAHVYPVLKVQDAEAAEEAEHGEEEHAEIKAAIAEVEASFSLAGMQKLKEVVTHHVEEEESELLPKLEETVPQILEELGGKFEQHKLNN